MVIKQMSAVMAAHRWTSETAAGDSTFVDRLGV